MLLFRKIKQKCKVGPGVSKPCDIWSVPFVLIQSRGIIVNRPFLIHMQLAASVFHRLTSKTTTSPIAALVLAWVLHHMEEAGKRKTLSPDLESTLNKIRRENTHANKILESYKK